MTVKCGKGTGSKCSMTCTEFEACDQVGMSECGTKVEDCSMRYVTPTVPVEWVQVFVVSFLY